MPKKSYSEKATELRAQLAAAGEREQALQKQLDDAQPERAELLSKRPELSARAHLEGDEAARSELKQMGARLLQLDELSEGIQHEVGKLKVEHEDLTGELVKLARAEQARLIAERDGTLVAIEKVLRGVVPLLSQAESSHAQAAALWDDAGGQNPPRWHEFARRVALLARTVFEGGRGRFSIPLAPYSIAPSELNRRAASMNDPEPDIVVTVD